jgi:hypothetical protein
MNRSGRPRLLPMFIIVVVVILVIFAIVSIGRALFAPSTSTDTQQADSSREALLNTSESRSVRVTARGPIVANENFKSYQIEVSPTKRSMVVYKDYLGTVENRSDLNNNQKAYEEFVYALDKANMMKGKVITDEAKDDTRGICASGYVYEYEILSGGMASKRLWTSTCDGSKGSLQASIGQLNNLFSKQIPDFEKIYPFRVTDAQLHL